MQDINTGGIVNEQQLQPIGSACINRHESTIPAIQLQCCLAHAETFLRWVVCPSSFTVNLKLFIVHDTDYSIDIFLSATNDITQSMDS